MPAHLLISIFCPDRVGLVAAITGRLFDLGANLGDTAFAVLGQGAEFTTLCEMPAEVAAADVEAALRALPELAGAKLSITPFDLGPVHGPSGAITHIIDISGGDRPGLIARLSEVFLQFDSNIVRLNTVRVPAGDSFLYDIRIAVRIPPERADGCLATVANTAGELALKAEWHKV